MLSRNLSPPSIILGRQLGILSLVQPNKPTKIGSPLFEANNKKMEQKYVSACKQKDTWHGMKNKVIQ